MIMREEYVLLRMDEAKNETESGLTISATEPPQALTGEVVAVGPGSLVRESVIWDPETEDWEFFHEDPGFFEGDRLLLARYHDGNKILVNGEELYLVNFYDIAAILDDDEEVAAPPKKD